MSNTPRTDAILALLPGGQSCDPQAVADDLRPEIARLEREIEELKDNLDGSEITHEATRADLRDCKRELEQERQDRKQADLDAIRALGERNDAREELAEVSKDFRCLAELLDGHDATECRANLVKLKQSLASELALADKLAARLDQCREDSTELLGERHWWKDEPRCEYSERYDETAENVVAAAEALDAYKAARES